MPKRSHRDEQRDGHSVYSVGGFGCVDIDRERWALGILALAGWFINYPRTS